jgi:hypothetical protein
MKDIEQIINGLRNLAKQRPISVAAQVVSVDKTQRTCTVEHDGLTYEDIRLNAVIDNNGNTSYIVPKPNSWVMITFIETSDTEAYITATSEVDEIIYTAKKISITADETIFNTGDFGGLVKIKELENNLNQLKTYCEGLKKAIQAGFTTLSPIDGTASVTTFNTASAALLINYVKMENEKIKQ